LQFFNRLFKLIETLLHPMNTRQQYHSKQLFKEEISELDGIQFVVLHRSARFK